MAIDYQSLAVKRRSGIRLPTSRVKPISEMARELGLDPAEIIKLASNETPLGPSKKATAAIESALTDLCLYPDGNGFDLKQKLSGRFDVGADQITLGMAQTTYLR